MFFFVGQRFYGKVHALGGACLTTRFTHFDLLPLVPHETYVVFAGPTRRGALGMPLVRSSVLSGYARAWSLAVAFVGAAVGGVAGIGVAAVAFAIAVAAWSTRATLSAEERLVREVYAELAGAPVDVAWIVAATRGADAVSARAWLDDIRRRAQQILEDEGADLAVDYRATARHVDFRGVAARPGAVTPRCRAAALTLARIASVDATVTSAERAAAASAHAQLRAAVREVRSSLGP